MPTYEYECCECRHRFEVFQKMNEKPVDKCIKCTGAVKRLIGAGAGIIFKGSGFYVTDYKKNPVVSDSPKKGSGKTGETKSEPAPSAATTAGCD